MSKYCHLCGKQLKRTAKFCNFCGAKQKRVQARSNETGPARAAKRKRASAQRVATQKIDIQVTDPQLVTVKPTEIQQLHKQRQPPVISQPLRNLAHQVGTQESYDMGIKPKLVRLEERIENFEHRESYSRADYNSIVRSVKELNILVDDPKFPSSTYVKQYHAIMARKNNLVVQILEYLTQGHQNVTLLNLQDQWQRITIDLRQTDDEISHIRLLDKLGEQLTSSLETVRGMIGNTERGKTNLSYIYSRNVHLTGFFRDTVHPQIREYLQQIEPSNHREIFVSETARLDRIDKLLDPSYKELSEFSTHHLVEVIRHFMKERVENQKVLRVVLQSLIDHKQDTHREYKETQAKLIAALEIQLDTGVSIPALQIQETSPVTQITPVTSPIQELYE
ncbi:MAG: hypothetical protein ACXAB7_18965, partial [Candidatus Kariarchaeaceae archaeon]